MNELGLLYLDFRFSTVSLLCFCFLSLQPHSSAYGLDSQENGIRVLVRARFFFVVRHTDQFWGYNWIALSLEDINTDTWPSIW
jgi:hypothetical protein